MLEDKYLILKKLKQYLIKNKVLYPKNPKNNKLTLRFLTIYGYTWVFQIELLGTNCIYPIFAYDRNNNNFEDFIEIATFLGFDLKKLEVRTKLIEENVQLQLPFDNLVQGENK